MKEKRIKNFDKFCLHLLLFFLLLGIIFFLGFSLGKESKSHPKQANSSNDSSQEKLLQANFDLFWESLRILKSDFYYQDKLDDQKLLYGAIKGLLQAAGDSYTEFLPPEEAKEFNEDIQGSFGGVGMEIGIRQGNLKVITPLKDTPAERAGLKPGDIILKIDDQITNNLSLSEAVRRIRGKVGTTVVLTIFRDDWSEPKEIKIVREKIEIPVMDWRIIEKDNHKIAYFQIYNFNENLRERFLKNAFQALFKNPEGIILDLRNNPGGYLDIAVEIAGWFLERGKTVVKEKLKDGTEKSLKARGNGFFAKKPVVILINKGSASASEILAGALRDNRQAKIIGETSFGKGSVQTIRYLEDNSSLKITIANWLTPNGDLIEKKGIEPDIKIENEKDKEIKLGSPEDKQFQKALEILIQEIESTSKKLIDYPKVLLKIQNFEVVR